MLRYVTRPTIASRDIVLLHRPAYGVYVRQDKGSVGDG